MPGDALADARRGATWRRRGGARRRERVDARPRAADLAEVIERHDIGLDHRRPDAVARRRATGQRTARENVADLVDDGSFVEYAPLVVAAQRRRRSLEELIERTPADGLVGGIGTVDGRSIVAMSYDYTVLAGTQGMWNHEKKDRLFELAERLRLPVVFFTEGGGGRPGDTDGSAVAGLDCLAFNFFARLSGLVPLVGITTGYCFAGNAALLGCCDVIIATEGSNIGMGGPAMIEGGGLGVYEPTAIGPVDVQSRERRGRRARAGRGRGRARRQAVPLVLPRTRRRMGVRRPAHAAPPRAREPRRTRTTCASVIDALCDTGSVLELRRGFGAGDDHRARRASKAGPSASSPTTRRTSAARSTPTRPTRPRASCSCCDAFDVPVVFLCDTPGFMVGPDSEATGAVRHMSRMFVTGANLTVPFGTIILRKGYGLGAQAMAGGSFKAPLFCVAWPTGRVRRHEPRRRGAARPAARARSHRRSRSSASARIERWSSACTSTARP